MIVALKMWMLPFKLLDLATFSPSFSLIFSAILRAVVMGEVLLWINGRTVSAV